MNKLQSFVRLDFMTVKPYLTVKNLLLFAATALILTAMYSDISSGMGVGMLIGTLLVGYPFAAGEKCNLDALYPTLSVGRKTVVLGRYVFSLVFNLCAVLFSIALAAAAMLAVHAFGWGFGTEPGTGNPLDAALVLSAVMIVIQAIQLPMYFRLGYTKARTLAIVPFAAMMAGYLAFAVTSSGLLELGTADALALAKLLETGLVIPAAVAAVLLIVTISYLLSLRFYRKREF